MAMLLLVACGQQGTSRNSTATSARVLASPTIAASPGGSNAAPPRLDRAGVAFDSATGELVLFGTIYSAAAFNSPGAPPQPGTATAETWTWKKGIWRRQSPAVSPPPRTSAGMAYDDAHNRVVLFGGQDAVAPVAGQGLPAMQDTWTWDGRAWTQGNPDHAPPAAVGPMLAYDPKIQKVVALVSPASGGSIAATWVWDGQTWSIVHPTLDVPGPRYGQIGYDATHGELVVFGGHAACTGPYQCTDDLDTWTFDGSNWIRHPGTSSGPAGRGGQAMATDPRTGSPVLFGGSFSTTFTFLADTWRWDGTAWTQLHPAASPWARAGAMAVSDSVDRSVLLYGGWWSTQSFGSEFYDIWEWINGSWQLAQPTTSDAPSDQREAIVQAASAGPGLLPFCGTASGSCMSLQGQPQMGYYSGYAVFDVAPPQGQNAQCVSYVSRDQPAGSWTFAGVLCGPIGGPMPQLGANATVHVSGCANVRSVPQIGQVLACLSSGTPVTIDDGPVNVQGALWWHLTGRGWMAHQLLH
jgi:hypothetical protein